ncbi:GNAT family N-acetyltransferase [Hoeflea sp. TYP-13]|uniref:GNAT family N-acetyltransferase n=1 Tax=Hoeflea sp. TYP-13 TaxID=3230023 RepID=UPI0034C5FD46
MIIRLEKPADRDAIYTLHSGAFPTDDEARLVDRLRQDGDLVLSLVAVKDQQIVGHIAFSNMQAPFPALGLAPVSVSEAHRRQGIAAALISRGLEMAKDQGCSGVFVLGDPDYYRRFGFSTEMAKGFQSPYAGPYLMAMPLADDELPSASGRVEYAAAFASLG